MDICQQLSLITDEISQDFEYVLKIAKKYGIEAVEVRSVWGKNISHFSDNDIIKMKNLLQKYDMKISVVSGPFAKCLLPSSIFDVFKNKNNFTLNPRYNLSLFDRLMEISDILDCNKIRIFNFLLFGAKLKYEKNWKRMRNILCPFIKKAEKRNKTLLLENEHICFANNVKNSLKILKEIDSPSFKLNLDPGNFYSAKEGVSPGNYQVFYDEGLVGHIHIKDATKRLPILGSSFGIVGKGNINYESLIHQALDNGYEGYFALETHCHKNKEEISLKSLDYLVSILKKA